MAGNNGANRACARNTCMSAGAAGNSEKHNERKKDKYNNQDIVDDRTELNVHYKEPDGTYQEVFDRLKEEKVIVTRGLKEDAKIFGELILDVNSAYFYNHGGYEFAKQFYGDAYKAAVEIVGGEQFIVSAVMHADERNRAMSEALGEDVYHYHLHVVYIPVVEKEIRWTKRCKDPALVGTVKETVMQVSSSKKWASKPALDQEGKPILTKAGKPVLRKSYSVLQDDFYNAMQKAGYTDIERGERGSSEEHLTVTQFKVDQEQQRLSSLVLQNQQLAAERATAEEEAKKAEERLKETLPKLKKAEVLAADFSKDPEDLLPQPELFETVKSYREKKAKPVLRKIVKVVKSIYGMYLDLKMKFEQLQKNYEHDVGILKHRIETLVGEKEALQKPAERYQTLCKVFGKEHMEAEVSKAEAQQKAQKREHSKNTHEL